MHLNTLFSEKIGVSVEIGDLAGRIYGRSLKVSAIEFFLRAKLLHCHGAPQVHRDSFVRGCAGVDVP